MNASPKSLSAALQSARKTVSQVYKVGGWEWAFSSIGADGWSRITTRGSYGAAAQCRARTLRLQAGELVGMSEYALIGLSATGDQDGVAAMEDAIRAFLAAK